jgi:protein O-mannosyl-transferase
MNGLSTSRRIGLICLALALGTLALYWPTIHFDFVSYGDPDSVAGNPHVQQGLTHKSLQWALQNMDAANWHPATSISHMAAYQIFGLHAGGHHAINLFLHIANVLLLFLLLHRLTRAPWPSAFVAALFAWHPLQIESVAWISGCSNVLGTLFFLLTVWAYVSYAEKPGFPRYLLSVVLFALALMSEPLLLTLPILLLLLDIWPLRRFASAPNPEALAQPQPLPRLIL